MRKSRNRGNGDGGDFDKNGGRASVMQRVISDVGAAVYESFTGRPLPPPARPARRAVRVVKIAPVENPPSPQP